MHYLHEYLSHLMDKHVIPGASYSLVTRNSIRKGHLGYAALKPKKQILSSSSIYDLASLTKVLVTTSLFLKALEEGCLTLDMKVSDVIVDFPYNDVKMEDLLFHRAGYPASVKDRHRYESREAMVEAAIAHERRYPSGQKIHYSDISFILLGHILEFRYQKRLDLLFDEKFLIPMGLEKMFFNPPKGLDYVATEWKQDRGNIVGEVHDETAYRMQGVSGHAGLFSNIEDLSVFVQMLLNDGVHHGKQILSENSLHLLRSYDFDDGKECRALGWQKNHRHRYCDLASEKALYHTGFTGTSILLDEESAFILLTNAVHPDRNAKEPFIAVRKQIHNVAMSRKRG